MENAVIEQTEPYIEKFERFEKQPARQPSWVFPLRKAGISRFAATGFPTLKDEDWRFTNVAPVAKLPFKPILQPAPADLSRESLNPFAFTRLAATRLVFVNGYFASHLSTMLPQPQGVIVQNLAAAIQEHSSLVEKHLGQQARTDSNSVASLNTAFFQDGGFIHVPAGKTLERPVHLLFISTAPEHGATTHPRNLILAEASSRATILESYVSTANTPYFTNAVTELMAGEGAVLEHLKYQDESLDAFHLAAIDASLGRGSNVILHSIATGAKLSRNSIRTHLGGEGLECVLNGLYLARDSQLADHHMVVEHAQPHCASHEYYNGILEGKAKGVFHGRILVRQAAQKTDAKQTNKNLLLSDEATIDTKPQLEIYADDVKCTHGATVGQLDDESIFYLRARGIGAETARRMLIHAFAGEIIDRIRHRPAREELDQLIWNRLETNPGIASQS